MVFILNKEYDMNGFIKQLQATGSKRIYLYMYIICTGGMVPSPLN